MQISRSRAIAATLLLLGATVLPAGLRAQSGPTGVPVGARVRLTVADSLRQTSFGPRVARLVGRLVRTSGDTFFVTPSGAVTPAAVPRSLVREVERSRGVSRMRSALQVGVVGGLTWAGLSAFRDDSQRMQNALAWGVAGVGLGAMLGAARPYESWQRVRP